MRQHQLEKYQHKKAIRNLENAPICALCLKRDLVDQEHIAPRRLGGVHDYINHGLLCRKCHPIKTELEGDCAHHYGIPAHAVLKNNNYMHRISGKMFYIKWTDPSQRFPLAGLGWPREKEYLDLINRYVFNLKNTFRWFCFGGMNLFYQKTHMEFMPVPIRSIKDLKALDTTYQPLLKTLELCYYLARVPTGYLDAGLNHHATTRTFQPYERREGVAEFLKPDSVIVYNEQWAFDILFDSVRCISAMGAGKDMKSHLERFLNEVTDIDRERFLKLIKVKASRDFPCLPHIPLLDAFPEDQKDPTSKKDVCFELFEWAVSRPVELDISIPDYCRNPPPDNVRKCMQRIDTMKLEEWEIVSEKRLSSVLHVERLQTVRERLELGMEYIRFLQTINSLDMFVTDVQDIIKCLDVTRLHHLLDTGAARLEACVAHLDAQTPPSISTPVNSPVRMQQWSPMSSPERSPSPELKTITLPKESLLAQRETLKRRRDEVAKEALELEYKMEINILEMDFVLKKEKIDRAYGLLETDEPDVA